MTTKRIILELEGCTSTNYDGKLLGAKVSLQYDPHGRIVLTVDDGGDPIVVNIEPKEFKAITEFLIG